MGGGVNHSKGIPSTRVINKAAVYKIPKGEDD